MKSLRTHRVFFDLRECLDRMSFIKSDLERSKYKDYMHLYTERFCDFYIHFLAFYKEFISDIKAGNVNIYDILHFNWICRHFYEYRDMWEEYRASIDSDEKEDIHYFAFPCKADVEDDYIVDYAVLDLFDDVHNFIQLNERIEADRKRFISSFQEGLERISRLTDKLFSYNVPITSEQKRQLMIDGFREFARNNFEEQMHVLTKCAKRFLNNRRDQLTTDQWDRVADINDEAVDLAIKNRLTLNERIENFYQDGELPDMRKNSLLLKFIQDTSSIDKLYDLESAMDNELFDMYIEFENLNFFFYRISLENLIKCGTNPELKEKYYSFLFGEQKEDEQEGLLLPDNDSLDNQAEINAETDPQGQKLLASVFRDDLDIEQIHNCFKEGAKYVGSDRELAYLYQVAADHNLLKIDRNKCKKFADVLHLWGIGKAASTVKLADNIRQLMKVLSPKYKSWGDKVTKAKCEEIGACFQPYFPYPTIVEP